MKFIRKIAPGLFGLLIYICIRLITDTASGFNVLLYRNQWINAFEILSAFGIGFILHYVVIRFERYQSQKPVTIRNVLSEFGLFALICVITLNATVGVVTMISDDGMDQHDFVVINLIPLLFLLIVYSVRRGNALLKSYVDQKTELERIKRDKSETELSFLKSQYHPHFLFNALNTIYFQMDDSTDKAKKTIEKLSDLLRYQLYDGQDELVDVQKEMAFLEKYINLQKERLPDEVQMEMNGKLTHHSQIYPLLTAPIVENACKYVAGKVKYITINYVVENDYFLFEVENSCIPQGATNKYSGIGISNLKKRLNLLYPERYQLDIRSTDNTFNVTLKIPTR